MWVHKYLVHAFCLKAVILCASLGIFAKYYDLPAPNSGGYNHCQLQVLTDVSDAAADWKALENWCSQNVWKQTKASSYLQKAYLWLNSNTVTKCHELTACQKDAVWSAIYMITFIILLMVDCITDHLLSSPGCYENKGEIKDAEEEEVNKKEKKDTEKKEKRFQHHAQKKKYDDLAKFKYDPVRLAMFQRYIPDGLSRHRRPYYIQYTDTADRLATLLNKKKLPAFVPPNV